MSQAKTVKEVLQAALWMYEHGLGWCKGISFRGRNSDRVCYTSGRVDPKSVYQACMVGAIRLVECDDDLRQKTFEIFGSLVDGKYGVGIASMNDGKIGSKKNLIKFLKDAINRV